MMLVKYVNLLRSFDGILRIVHIRTIVQGKAKSDLTTRPVVMTDITRFQEIVSLYNYTLYIHQKRIKQFIC